MSESGSGAAIAVVVLIIGFGVGVWYYREHPENLAAFVAAFFHALNSQNQNRSASSQVNGAVNETNEWKEHSYTREDDTTNTSTTVDNAGVAQVTSSSSENSTGTESQHPAIVVSTEPNLTVAEESASQPISEAIFPSTSIPEISTVVDTTVHFVENPDGTRDRVISRSYTDMNGARVEEQTIERVCSSDLPV